jgi:diguanylate cyclase (GGDEF)-like protein/PAS domain S-box-containing protein
MINTEDSRPQDLSARAMRRRLAFAVVLVNLFAVSLAGFFLRQSWNQFQERAENGTANLARVLEEEIAGDIEKIDASMLTVSEEMQRRMAVGGINEKELNAFLDRQLSHLPEALSLRVTDSRGAVEYGAEVRPGSVSVADRAYFLRQRDAASSGLVIEAPVFARISKQWSVPMSRRISRPDGSFAGVVYVNLAVDHLTSTFKGLELGRNGVASLSDGEMRNIARYPEVERAGTDREAAMPALQALAETGQTAGTYRTRGMPDGIDRTYSFRKVGNLPLYVSVGFARDDYMAEWRQSLAVLLVWQLLFLAVTVLVSWKAYRGWQRQRRAAQELALSAKVFEESSECIVITDERERILSVNRAFVKVTGYSPEEVIGQTPRIMTSGRQDAEFYRNMWRSIAETSHWCGEIWDKRKNGEPYPKWLNISAVKDAEERITNYIGVFSDITERKRVEAHIEFLAYHDALTELPNRLLAMDHLELAIAHAERAGSKAAVLFLDLDNFKTINDSYGHTTGDGLLQAVARRLRKCTRDTDTVSRQGGDEFLIILSDVRDPDGITATAEKILGELEDTIQVEGHELATSLSMGVAVYPDDGEEVDTLLKHADTAMYHAKEAGRNTFRFYTEEMNVHAVEHQRIRVGLRRALERGELVLHYQPQIDLASGRIVGAEALVRWDNPESGLLPPGDFIPTAEDSGLIVPIGDWVLREACRQAAAWHDAGLPDIVVAVNVSATQFRRGDLEKSVLDALMDSGLSPSRLELELTESILMQDTEKMLDAVQRLKAYGLMLSIDDFGTGYSSLSYLKRFDVDKVKIDRSFISEMLDSPQDASIVRAIIQMARSMNMKTIAEGVENEDVLAFLRQQACDEAQGYHFARPMPAAEFARYLAASLAREAGAVVTTT